MTDRREYEDAVALIANLIGGTKSSALVSARNVVDFLPQSPLALVRRGANSKMLRLDLWPGADATDIWDSMLAAGEIKPEETG